MHLAVYLIALCTCRSWWLSPFSTFHFLVCISM